jgi:ribosomal protein S18 acetylase RimI-like enzyme
MVIRQASDTDLAAVADIKVRSWADTYATLLDNDTLAPFLDGGRQLEYLREVAKRSDTLLLVADEDGAGVVGFALTFLEHAPEPWLESLHVLREHRSRGAGELLMRATAEELTRRGHHTMRLGVIKGNVRAARFYARLGAVFAGREPAGWAPHVWHELYRWPDLERLRLPRR